MSVPSQPESLPSTAPSCATTSILLQDLGLSELGCLQSLENILLLQKRCSSADPTVGLSCLKTVK